MSCIALVFLLGKPTTRACLLEGVWRSLSRTASRRGENPEVYCSSVKYKEWSFSGTWVRG